MSAVDSNAIVDVHGRQITKGVIVGMSDPEGPWSPYQGLVVVVREPVDSKDIYCVGVFFNLDVPPHEFYRRDVGHMPIAQWDDLYTEYLRADDVDFIFAADAAWRICPRVRFFAPNELEIQKTWKIETLAKKVFPNGFHRLFSMKSTLPVTSFQCFCENCSRPAVKIAMYNFWGSVYPCYTCKECFPTINGWYFEGGPQIKKPFLLVDGSPVPEEEVLVE